MGMSWHQLSQSYFAGRKTGYQSFDLEPKGVEPITEDEISIEAGQVQAHH